MGSARSGCRWWPRYSRQRRQPAGSRSPCLIGKLAHVAGRIDVVDPDDPAVVVDGDESTRVHGIPPPAGLRASPSRRRGRPRSSADRSGEAHRRVTGHLGRCDELDLSLGQQLGDLSPARGPNCASGELSGVTIVTHSSLTPRSLRWFRVSSASSYSGSARVGPGGRTNASRRRDPVTSVSSRPASASSSRDRETSAHRRARPSNSLRVTARARRRYVACIGDDDMALGFHRDHTARSEHHHQPTTSRSSGKRRTSPPRNGTATESGR